jgi:hypothetical protein
LVGFWLVGYLMHNYLESLVLDACLAFHKTERPTPDMRFSERAEKESRSLQASELASRRIV